MLGRLIPDFGKIVAMMQFNDVPPLYGRRAPDPLHRRAVRDRARRRRDDHPLSHSLMPRPEEAAARCSMSRCCCTTSPRAGRRTIPRPARRSRGASARIWGCRAADTETVAWLVEKHLLMSMTAQTRDLNDRKTIEDFAAIVQIGGAAEAAADPHRLRHPRRRARRLERLEGAAAAHALLRNRAAADRRLLGSLARRARRRRARQRWPRRSPIGRTKPSAALCRPALRQLPADRSTSRTSVRHADFIREADAAGKRARHDGQDPPVRGGDRNHRAGAGPSAASLGHCRRMRRRRRQHRRRADLHHL